MASACEQDDSEDYCPLTGNYTGAVWKGNLRLGFAEITILMDDEYQGSFNCLLSNENDMFLFGRGSVYRDREGVVFINCRVT